MKKQGFLIALLILSMLVLVGCKKTLTTSTYQTESAVNKITFEDTVCDLEIKTTDESNLYFEYNELKETYTYTITMNNQTGSLVIKRKDNRKGFYKSNFNSTPKTTIYVPEEAEVELSIKVGTGNISVDGLKSKAMNIEASTGNISLLNITSSEECNITARTGNISITDSNISSFKSDITKAGNYEIDNSSFSDKLELIGYATKASLKGTTSNSITIEIKTGEVEFKNAEVLNILNITVTTGDIDVSLLGKRSDYTVTKKTGMGDNTVQGDGALIVNLTTTVGDINVEYLR